LSKNASNYIEPARVIASKGANLLFIPTNNCLKSHNADPALVTIARNKHIAKAIENGMAVVSADVAGRCGNYISYGCTNIIDSDGQVIASSKLLSEDLLIADIEPKPPSRFTKWDAAKNPAIVQAYRESCYTDVEPYAPTHLQKHSS
jgi:predicted amidohydrolase